MNAARPDPARWRTGETAPSKDELRGVRRFVALAALLALAGAIVGALYWINPAEPPVLSTFPVMEYKDPVWPPNPWAEEDSDALIAAYPAWANRAKGFNFQESALLLSQLQTLQAAKSNRPVVLHLTALGAVDGGIVYVLPGDAKPGLPATWLKLDLVLKAFADCPAKHKLLLLDLAHPTADMFHGPLADAVADELDRLLLAREKEGKLPFFVLTSCSKDEFSLPMDEEQQSAFAFYVGEGLRGAAEGFGPNGRHDDRIQVGELAAFVGTRVQRWARDCRGLRQTPKAYGVPDDFDVTDRRLSASEAKEGRTYPPWLFDAWRRRDEWLATGVFRPARPAPAAAPDAPAKPAPPEKTFAPTDWLAKGVYRSAPVAVNALHFYLVPAEQDWQAMSRPDRVERIQRVLESDVDKASKISAKAKMDPLPPLRSVNALPPPPKPPDDWPGLIDTFLESALNPKEAEKAKENRKAVVDKAKPSPETRKQVALLVWRRLVSDSAPKRDTVVALARLLDDVQPDFTMEAQAARRLANWNLPGGTFWPETAVHQMLRTEDAASTALAAAPDAFPAARESFAAAKDLQIAGEKLLFDVESRNRPDQARAAKILKQSEDAFADAKDRMAAVQAARRAVEDAAFVLPAVAGRVADEGKPTDLLAWREAAKAAAVLNDRLEHPPTGREFPIGEWESATARLAAPLKILMAPYQPAAVKLRVEDLATGRAPQYQALHAMLVGPLLPATERRLVWEKASAIAARLHAETREADAANTDILPPGTNRAPDPPLKGEGDRRERRAELSIALLRVAGSANVEKLAADRRAAIADKTKWEPLAGAIRAGWTEQLPKEAKEWRDKKEWPAADRRERFLSPEHVPVDRSPAAIEGRRWDQSEYLKWLETYFRALAELRPAARTAYEDAADGVRRARGD